MFGTFSSIASMITTDVTSLIITACPDPTASDLLWYKFDSSNGIDTASGTLKNYAGTMTNLTGCLINTPTLNANNSGTGQTTGFGSVTLGTGSPYRYIVCPLAIPMAEPRANGWTISCWVKIPSSAATSNYNISIFAFPTSYGQHSNSFPYSVMKQSATQAYISCSDNTAIYYPIGKFYDDQWHLHTVTLNGGTGKSIKFYFDGVQLGTSTGGPTILQNYNTTNGNTFGFLNWGGTGIWTIPALQYADLRIYKSVIPDDKVRGLYRDTAKNHP
jgi:hypothetical protein